MSKAFVFFQRALNTSKPPSRNRGKGSFGLKKTEVNLQSKKKTGANVQLELKTRAVM
jgi:hypothetical protein